MEVGGCRAHPGRPRQGIKGWSQDQKSSLQTPHPGCKQQLLITDFLPGISLRVMSNIIRPPNKEKRGQITNKMRRKRGGRRAACTWL